MEIEPSHNGFLITSGTRICIDCEAQPATSICTDCEDDYCTYCFTKSHSRGKMSTHGVESITPYEVADSTPFCSTCTTERATRQCVECAPVSPFCEWCFHSEHAQKPVSAHAFKSFTLPDAEGNDENNLEPKLVSATPSSVSLELNDGEFKDASLGEFKHEVPSEKWRGPRIAPDPATPLPVLKYEGGNPFMDVTTPMVSFLFKLLRGACPTCRAVLPPPLCRWSPY